MESRKNRLHRGKAGMDTLLAKKIYCGNCGTLFRRKTVNGKTYWTCHRHDRQKDFCGISQIQESEITNAVLRMYHKLKAHYEEILTPVLSQLTELREKELRSNRKINDIDKEIAQLAEQNLVLVRLKSKGYVDSALYLSQTEEITIRLRELRAQRRRIMDATGEDSQLKATEAMLDYLEGSPEVLTTLDEELFESLMDRLTVITETELNIRLHNSLILKESMERTVR